MAGEIEKWDDVSQLEVSSQTQLTDDTGHGKTAVIRMFEFKANKEAFKAHVPTKQELFLSHQQFIENQLWGDGFSIMYDSPPRVSINKRKTKYAIFVGAEPRNGMVVAERPKTLTQIANNL